MRLLPIKLPFSLLAGLLLCKLLLADHFYVVDLSELDFSEPQTRSLDVQVNRHAWSTTEVVRFPRLIIEGAAAEAYVSYPEQEDANRNWWGREPQRSLRVALRLPEKTTIRGQALLVQNDFPLRVAQHFTFDPNAFEETTEAAFKDVRQSHYHRLATAPAPGTHWFRYLAGEINTTENRPRSRANGSFESTFEMFSGNRAVSENLALDRELILANNVKGKPSPIDLISGVTVNPIDWSEHLSTEPTAIDPLASVIPHDQHVAFFDSIKSLNRTLDALEADGITLFQSFQNRGHYAQLGDRYQQQMGLLIPDLIAEQLPVESIAITGGDPFLPSGSDVTVLFQTQHPQILFEALHALIQTQAARQGAQTHPDPLRQDGTTRAYSTPDRRFSSVLFAGDNYVAVTNSPQQVQRYADVDAGTLTALGHTEEFKFFRQRYPLDEAATAFVFLSDATIRRWSSPAFRIGASRRVRAAAVLGQAQAQILAEAPASQAYTDLVGTLQVEGATARSEIYNTLAFLTPISELEITTVTPAEKQAYERWRRGYESGWVVFDPIALQLHINDSARDIDLSVMPLRVGSRYEDWIELAGDAQLDAVALNPHKEALMMASFAIDSNSQLFQSANLQSQSMLPGLNANPLAWIGESLSIYIDTDPFWHELAEQENAEKYIQSNLSKLPLGIRISSKSVARLALFLTGLRGMSQQAAPGLLVWETREHETQAYVVISAKDRTIFGEIEFQICYAALPDAFLLSLNEAVLKRAITRNTTPATDEPIPGEEPPFHAFAKVQTAAIPQYFNAIGEDLLHAQQLTSWAALPILNEWHQRHPQQDPVALHAHYFQEAIRCPGGQGYQWNAVSQSMESVAFGTPEAPRGVAASLPLLQNWAEAQASLSFEDDGLRLRAKLTR